MRFFMIRQRSECSRSTGKSQDSTAIDAAKGTVLGTIKLDGKPEFAASDGKGGVFVNIEDKSELTAIDPNKLEVKSKWPLAPCESPSGLSMDRKNRRLFVGCDNKMMAVVNADTRQSAGHAGDRRRRGRDHI